jgi:hypothetical protein
MVLRVASFLPFNVTAYLNGHNFIEREFIRQGISFSKDDNRFLSVSDPQALEAAADTLTGDLIQQRVDHWTFIRFSAKERLPAPACGASIRSSGRVLPHFIFKRSWPIASISAAPANQASLLTADQIANLFGQP